MKKSVIALEQWLQSAPKLIKWGLVFVWYGVIFTLSHIPAATSASTQVMVGGDDTLNAVARFCAHLGVFGVLGLLVYAALAPSLEWKRRTFALSLAAVIVFAVSDEVHQAYVPGRHARLQDVLTDTAGAALCIYALTSLRRRIQR